jgi:hypothetical protein
VPPIERKNNVRVLFSDEEKRMVRYLAERRGLKVADTVRTLVREAFRSEVSPRVPEDVLEILKDRFPPSEDDE